MEIPSPAVAIGVFMGGGLGALARYGLAAVVEAGVGARVPQAGIVACNLVGCLLIGFLTVAITTPAWRVVVMTGLLGGFTTYSAFAWYSTDVLAAGRWGPFIVHLALHVGGGLVAVTVGGFLARRVFG